MNHFILTDSPPVHSRARRFSPEISSGPSPLHIVLKKEGSLYPCREYRRLNEITVPDRYPVPNIRNDQGSKVAAFFQRIDDISNEME